MGTHEVCVCGVVQKPEIYNQSEKMVVKKRKKKTYQPVVNHDMFEASHGICHDFCVMNLWSSKMANI